MPVSIPVKKRTSGSARLDALSARIIADAPAATGAEPPRRAGVLERRQVKVQDVIGGRSRQVRIRAIDPSRVRIWPGHDRDYAALTAERCGDLIAGFRRSGQQFPAVVRLIENDPEHDVELVCGARRHWTATHLGLDLQVEERRLSDLEAFSLMDSENRDREDISDHERACNYVRAVDRFFEGNRSRMAAHLNIDPGNFTRLLRLAELPDEILGAYGDRRELVVHHGQLYTKALANPVMRRRLLEAAVSLQGSELPGRKVFAALREAVGPGSKRSKGRARPRASEAAGGSLGGLRWSAPIGGGSSGECEVVFERPAEGDGVAISRLKGEFAALLEQLAAPASKTGTHADGGT